MEAPPTPEEPPRAAPRRRDYAIAAACAALVSLLPFARGLLSGESFFFRDLSRAVFPQKLLLAQGLLHGELWSWNPYVHEGEAMRFQPLGYPLDLLHLLAPSEWGISAVLAAHVPLAAVGFVWLARRLGAPPLAAAGGAVIYALGGFPLSLLNLNAALQAHAWTPTAIAGLLRAAEGRWRDAALAALPLAVLCSTGAAEFVGQALLVALVLAAGRSPRLWARLGVAAALGLMLAAFVLLPTSGLVEGSSRGQGLAPAVVLAHSVHPITWLQVVVAGLYGDPSNLINRWWGENFFPLGFPYILSLYEGLAVVLLAALGIRRGGGPALRLTGLALFGGIICLGSYAGLAPLVEAAPSPLRVFRYATKAFFTVHLALALLAALGLAFLLRSGPAAWRRLAAAGLVLGGLFVLAPLLPGVLPGPIEAFAGGFFPPAYPWLLRQSLLGEVLRDAAAGGAVAAACGGVGLLVSRGRLGAGTGGPLLVTLVATDLLRAGAGLNPTVTPAFYGYSEATRRIAAQIRSSGGRLYTCEATFSSSYATGRAAHADDHEVWTFAVEMDTLSPNYNMSAGVRSALSRDLTMLVPEQRVLEPAASSCRDPAALEPRWRRAGVAWVLALHPLRSPGLRTVTVAAPPRIAPLQLVLHSLADPLPLRVVATRVRAASSPGEAERLAEADGFQLAGGVAVEGGRPAEGVVGRILEQRERPGHIELEVEADAPTVVAVRDAWASGWSATVDGVPAPVQRADGRHMAVPIPPGRSRVVLTYRPRRFAAGALLSGLAALAIGLIAAADRRAARAQEGSE